MLHRQLRHAAAHVAAQAEAQVAADAQMALKAEAQVVVHPKNHVENRTGQDETRGTVPETTGETSHGQVSAEGAGTRSNVEPGPISERKPGPNFGTISELKDETSDEPQIGSTARAISELSADTMPATVAQMVWESRSGPKAEELKSVTISVTKSKTNIETNAEITAAVPAPKSDLTSTLEHESTAEMPEPRFTANANHALNTEARFASKHGPNSETIPLSERRKSGPNFGTTSALKYETSDEPQIGSTARAISGLAADTMPATVAQMVWESRSGPKAEELKSLTTSVTKSKTNIETNAEITAAVPAPKSDLTSTLEHESTAEMPEPRFTQMANANHPLNTEAGFASKHGPNSETIPLSERRKSGPNFGTTSALKYETSDEPQIESTARAISGLSVDTMPATVAQMVWESRSGPKAEELKSLTTSVTKSKTNIETNAEITAAVPAPKSDLTSTLEHESSAEMPEPRFTPKSKMTNANHPLNTEARFASKHGPNSETMPELKSETDERNLTRT